MTQPSTVRVLLVEDNPADARLVVELLNDESRAAGSSMMSIFEVVCADRMAAAVACIAQQIFDVILLDLSLPDSLGIDTFEQLHVRIPFLPIILLTGFHDEALGYQAVQAGAQDYLVKGQINGPLLARAIWYAVERSRLVAELRGAMASIRALTGLLPMCAWCKGIRNDSGYWESVETYMMKNSDVEVSHCLCSDCAVKIYPEWTGQA